MQVFLPYRKRPLLLLEKILQLLTSNLLGRGTTASINPSATASPKAKIITEVRTLLVNNPLSLRLSTLIISASIKMHAVPTNLKIGATLNAAIISANASIHNRITASKTVVLFIRLR